MDDGIFHQWLQQQRRHGTSSRVRIAFARDREARAEPHLLDGKEPLGERPFICKRNAAARPEAERVAEKIGEQQAHRSRGGGISRRQRADRMQTVENEVGIDLRAQRAQLGLPREKRLLERAGFRVAGRLKRDEEIVTGRREPVEQGAYDEQQRALLRVERLRPEFAAERVERACPEISEGRPYRARGRGCDRLHDESPSTSSSVRRSGMRGRGTTSTIR